jgi:hypothetical protein
MARIFTATFNYKKGTYSALITITGIGADKKVSVKLIDESLRHELSEGKVELDYKQCIATDEDTLKNGGSIVECIALAVKKHEIDRPPVAM